ncbi:MAG: dimethylsulfonioproprionate lyase family protein [Pseudomonadota bacterium]
MAVRHSVHESEVVYKDYSDHNPKPVLEAVGAKVLIGPDGVNPNHEISMALMEINPGRIYPLHSHVAPEIYCVLEGKAKCIWGQDEFRVRSGTAIQTIPGTPHRIEVIGDQKFRALAFW